MQRVLVKLIVSEHLFYLLKSVTYVLSHYTLRRTKKVPGIPVLRFRFCHLTDVFQFLRLIRCDQSVDHLLEVAVQKVL
jgi:hypothetical protein